MKKTAYFALILGSTLLAHAQKAQAPGLPPQNVAFSPLSAEGLVAFCKDAEANPSSTTAMACLSYVAGFRDGFGVAMAKFNHEKQSAFCPPPEVTNQQVAKVIVKSGADHPNQLWTGAALFTALALKDAYPCQE